MRQKIEVLNRKCMNEARININRMEEKIILLSLLFLEGYKEYYRISVSQHHQLL